MDQKLIEFIREVDVLIIDPQYDEGGVAPRARVGWGHRCVSDVSSGGGSRGETSFSFHHDPGHDDDFVSAMLENARQVAAAMGSGLKIDAAREGEEVSPAGHCAGGSGALK